MELINVYFPVKSNQRYWDIHYKYVYSILSATNIFRMVLVCEKNDKNMRVKDYDTKFMVSIEKKKVIFDFSDFHDNILEDRAGYAAYYKFHTHEEQLENGIIPFPPVSFYDWNEFKMLSKKIKYKATGDMIVNCQRPYGNATERRTKIQQMMKSLYGDKFDISLTPQQDYFMKINNCLVAVFVPGATNNMLDRGQWQYMAFGCATISPRLPEILPNNLKIKPDVHYIMCKDDYSDLPEKIEWCKTNRKKCLEIGENAKHLFEISGTPASVAGWILETIG